jgi:hypothetical protein
MKMLFALSVMVLCFVGCNDPTGPTPASRPRRQPLNPWFTSNIVVTVYSATFTASAACAQELPSAVRTRSYVASFMNDGSIQWSGPTVHAPPGHRTISSGSLVGNRFSFSLGLKHDPQSDEFNGIWDNLSASEYFNIEGNGDGRIEGATISGSFSGLFAFYTRSATETGDVWCKADDHGFSLVKQ